MESDRRLQVYYLMKSGIKSPKIIHQKTNIPLSIIYDIKKRIESGFSVEKKDWKWSARKVVNK
jgi:hypothetical protein